MLSIFGLVQDIYSSAELTYINTVLNNKNSSHFLSLVGFLTCSNFWPRNSCKRVCLFAKCADAWEMLLFLLRSCCGRIIA